MGKKFCCNYDVIIEIKSVLNGGFLIYWYKNGLIKKEMADLNLKPIILEKKFNSPF